MTREKRKPTTYSILLETTTRGGSVRLVPMGQVDAFTPETARRRAIRDLEDVEAYARKNGQVTLYAIPALSMRAETITTEVKVVAA